MSKQSEAKQAQGYDPKPVNPVCMNCKHYRSKLTELAGGWIDESEKRCGIGGFAVKKMGSCKLYERKD